ncbi:MAG: DUF3726 domain-containing protein [Chloroflexota bacterium]
MTKGMKVSYNEITVLCQKVYEGLGFDVAVYEDAGELVSWLALHGLDGLSLFEASTQQASTQQATTQQATTQQATTQQATTQPMLAHESECVLVFDLQQTSSLVAGILPLELGYAKSKTNKLTMMHLQRCTQPLLLLGALVRFAKRGIHVFAHWHDEAPNGGSECVVSVIAGESYPTLHEHIKEGNPSAMTIIFSTDFGLLPTMPAHSEKERIHSPDWFQQQANEHMEQGITVDTERWLRLQALAANVLVEATEASRQRGAGEDAASQLVSLSA